MSPEPAGRRGARRRGPDVDRARSSSTARRSSIKVVDDLARPSRRACRSPSARRSARALVLLALFWRRRTGLALLVVALAADRHRVVAVPRRCRPRPARCSCGGCCPAVAAVSLLVALALGRRLVSYALVLLAALELAVWVWLRRDGAFRAVIPTDAPFWLDRGVMAATAVVAVAAGDRGRRGDVPPAGG